MSQAGAAQKSLLLRANEEATFVSVEGGKNKTPLWLLERMPHNYFYNDIDEVLDMIRKIDSGEKKIDSDRWRLLRKELR